MDPATTPPKPPKHLSAKARRWWKTVLSDFEIEQSQLETLRLAAEAMDRCDKAREVLDKQGLTFIDFRGAPKARPEVAIVRDNSILFARLTRELALDLGGGSDDLRLPRIGGRE